MAVIIVFAESCSSIASRKSNVEIVMKSAQPSAVSETAALTDLLKNILQRTKLIAITNAAAEIMSKGK